MSTNLTFQMPHIPQTIVIYGVGGTGSRIVPALAQLMSKMPTLINPEMILVDFDVVEPKNLDRQNFASSDVGKNKAEALAARYAKAFGVKITPITVAAGTKEYTEALQMFGVYERLASPSLHVIAVDSANARREILKSAMQMQTSCAHSSVVIDCGNEDIFGQVGYFTTGRGNHDSAMEMETVYNWYQGVIPGQIVVPDMPFDPDYYINMTEGVSTRSCADLDQTLAINNIMAAQAVIIAQNIMMGKPMNYHRVTFNLFHGVSHENIQIPDMIRRMESLGKYHSGSQCIGRELTRGVTCNSNVLSTQMHELFSSLDSEMLSNSPARYEMSKTIRETLGLPAFEPSLMLAARYPEQYRPEWIELWKKGYELPQIPEKDREVFEELQRVFAEMQAECDRLNKEAAENAAPVAEEAE